MSKNHGNAVVYICFLGLRREIKMARFLNLYSVCIEAQMKRNAKKTISKSQQENFSIIQPIVFGITG
jgi:hypothetical protein